jgi:hypothetical protein
MSQTAFSFLAQRSIESNADPGVSIGIYAALLSSFGMLERLEHLLDAPFDKRGLAQERAQLPQRIHASPTMASDPDALKKMGLS